jgi:hypothetical protein
MVTGSEQGKMVYIDWNLLPENFPRITHMSFLDWYENFFIEVISGNNVDDYGYVLLGSEEELMMQYANAQMEKKRDILFGFFRFPEIQQDTVNFLKRRDLKIVDDLRVELLLKYDRKAAMELFDRLFNGENVEGAIACARRMPDENKDQYYQAMVKMLFNSEIIEKKKILFFLTECKSLSAKDLVSFAMDETLDEENRVTAIWAMNRTTDKQAYIDRYISWMRSDSYWIAINALQGMANENDPRLTETYHWMWDRYKQDATMRANLSIAFRGQ